MQELKKLLKESFELWVKKRWLKEIDRAIERYKKTYAKATREHYVMNRLIEEYKKIYDGDVRSKKMVNEKLLIDVNQAIAEMNRVETNHPYDDNEDILEACINILHNASTVDAVEVVHGRWVMKETMIRSPFAKNYYCSECKEETNCTSNYCPHCGAKMDGRSNVPREA